MAILDRQNCLRFHQAPRPLLARFFTFVLSVALLCCVIASGCGKFSAPPTTDSFTTRTSQQGSLLVLSNQTTTDVVRLALDTTWGGSIVEVSENGTNYVNQHDPGRLVQPAFYDGNAQYDNCSGCTNHYGWNPVLGGDKYGHGTPILTQTLTVNSLYTKARALQWNPDDKGGGPSQPILSDLLIEQTITPVAGYARAFRAHYKITHLGSDLHANAFQEFPAVYVSGDYNRFVSYEGPDPWTSASVTTTQFPAPGTPSPNVYVPEQWGAYVNDENIGLTVFDPAQYPYARGVSYPASNTAGAANYFAPLTALTIGPNFSFEADYFLIAGDYRTARQIVYALHDQFAQQDVLPPFGAMDTPASGTSVKGATIVSGWAFDEGTVSKVEVLVDGQPEGIATYGLSRQDIPAAYKAAPPNTGFSYSLDTTAYPDGPHVLTVRVTSSTGRVATYPNVNVTISN